jgi:hypothetical protein
MFSHIYMQKTAIISFAYLRDKAKCIYIHVHLYIQVRAVLTPDFKIIFCISR